MKSFLISFCVAAVITVLFGAHVSNAAIVSYTSQSSFLAVAPVVTTADFDSYSDGVSLGVGSATVDGVVYEANQPTADWSIREVSVLNPPSQPNVFGVGNLSPLPVMLSFRDEQSSGAIGFYMVHQVVSPRPTWDITVEDATGATLALTVSFGTPGFFGFTSPTGIVSVEIADNPSDNRETNFWFDDVSRSSIVPEPSTFAMAGLGLLGLGLFARRRKKPSVV